MHNESAHLPETLNNATFEGESAHICTESPESSSLDNALSTKMLC